MLELQKAGIRTEMDTRSEKIGFKIREAQLAKIPYMLVIGDNEVETEKITVRSRKEGDLGTFELSDFVGKLVKEKDNKAI
jgi:threonyl-tRNA synthetase